MSDLPGYLQSICKVVIDESVQNSNMAKRVQTHLAPLPWEVISPGEQIENAPGDILYLKHYKGDFLRFCPGTRYYRCCGYQIIHIGENCPLRCSYCILQAYFQDRILKVWANQEDLWTELDKKFKGQSRRFRVGTGEFTDSLVLEPLTGYSKDLVKFLGKYEQVCLELKSKVVNLDWMEVVKRPDRILPAWSVNAPQIVDREEQGDCSSLEQRLEAAQKCVSQGFRVCLHFDPIIYFPGWEKGYGQTIDMIFDYLRPANIAYMSLGSFRFMPDLKKTIASNFPDTNYIYGEFITGLDNKQRLLRPLRVQQFKFMVEKLRAKGMDKQLYFCMESDEVWQQVFDYTPKKLGGLTQHLMNQAFGE